MNDFTKEELESIVNLIDVYCDGDSMVVLSYAIFRNKIQSMIDNYYKNECLDIRDTNCIEPCPTCGEHHDNQ
jgi:hypothetical protein